MVFGILLFVLKFLRNICSLVANVHPLNLVLFDPEVSLTLLNLAISLNGAVQMIIGNVIEAKPLGSALELHLITVRINQSLWVIFGVLLEKPITAALVVLLESIEITKPIASLSEEVLPTSQETDEPEPSDASPANSRVSRNSSKVTVVPRGRAPGGWVSAAPSRSSTICATASGPPAPEASTPLPLC